MIWLVMPELYEDICVLPRYSGGLGYGDSEIELLFFITKNVLRQHQLINQLNNTYVQHINQVDKTRLFLFNAFLIFKTKCTYPMYV